ncbi:MAG TPA: PAAR domain-containing protein [Acetobacteraceae bacterium]|nr:PAAR domain-containing protein [Acetobacteraceae bacterium]
MPMPAARMTDQVMQTTPHCHAPIHPPAPTPTPIPHPGMPLMIMGPCAPTVLIGGLPAARISDQTMPCMMVACVPAGPGMIVAGNPAVLICGMPAARLMDQTAHATCVAPIPGPIGQIIGPCCPTVLI